MMVEVPPRRRGMGRPGRRVGGRLDLVDAVVLVGMRVPELPHVVRVDAEEDSTLPPADDERPGGDVERPGRSEVGVVGHLRRPVPGGEKVEHAQVFPRELDDALAEVGDAVEGAVAGHHDHVAVRGRHRPLAGLPDSAPASVGGGAPGGPLDRERLRVAPEDPADVRRQAVDPHPLRRRSESDVETPVRADVRPPCRGEVLRADQEQRRPLLLEDGIEGDGPVRARDGTADDLRRGDRVARGQVEGVEPIRAAAVGVPGRDIDPLADGVDDRGAEDAPFGVGLPDILLVVARQRRDRRPEPDGPEPRVSVGRVVVMGRVEGVDGAMHRGDDEDVLRAAGRPGHTGGQQRLGDDLGLPVGRPALGRGVDRQLGELPEVGLDRRGRQPRLVRVDAGSLVIVVLGEDAHSHGATPTGRPCDGGAMRNVNGPGARSEARGRAVRWGESEQAGSVFAGSPVSRAAWHRQPPKSISRRSQLRQGSGIHAVPRNRLNASDVLQIAARGRSRTFSNRMPGIAPAVGQGSTSPTGLTVR